MENIQEKINGLECEQGEALTEGNFSRYDACSRAIDDLEKQLR